MGLGKPKANDGQDINCVGTVFYGHSHSGNFVDLFSDPNNRKSYAKKRSNGKMKCSYELFGDVAPGLPKSCWCDADADLEPYVVPDGNIVEPCANEGEPCNCQGTVHYGLGNDGDFKAMSTKYFKSREVSEADAKNGFMLCSNMVFGDPFPSKAKQCFCERQEKPENLKEDNLSKCASEGEKC